MKQFEKRVRALERLAPAQSPTEPISTTEAARLLCFLMREGVEAQKEIDAADASHDPERRAELTKRLWLGRSAASTLAKYSPGKVIAVPFCEEEVMS